MPKNFNDKLINLLKNNPRFVDEEGELVTAAAINSAWQNDPRPCEITTLRQRD